VSDSAEDRALELVGKTLGEGYRLDALVGLGSMGAVYRATSASGEVAVKTLNASAMGQETSQRFLRESELVRRLKHPHVVRTLDSGVDAATGLMFLVMPLLKGRDLDRVLEELGALKLRAGSPLRIASASFIATSSQAI
jgi:serine/threonine protein kinase